MASGKINKSSSFFVKVGEYAVNSGYFVVEDNRIRTDSSVFVQLVRGSNEWQTWSPYPRIDANGAVLICLRDSNGVPPTNGLKFNANILVYTH